MSVTNNFILALLLVSTTAYALDSKQIREREFERPAMRPTTQQPSPQESAQTNVRQEQQRRDGGISFQDNSSLRSQLPQVRLVNIDTLKAQTDGFQPEAPAEYQYQTLQTLTTQEGNSEQKEDAKPEIPVEEVQLVHSEETMVEAEPQPLDEATGEEQLVTHAVEGNAEYRIIEDNNRIVVLQVENRQSQ